MKIGGRKTRSVFERYAIVSQSDIRDAVTKLEAGQQRDKRRSCSRENRGKTVGQSLGRVAPKTVDRGSTPASAALPIN